MGIQEEIASTAGEIVGTVEKELREAAQLAEEKALLMVMKMEMKKEVKAVISEEKERVDQLESDLDKLKGKLGNLMEQISDAAAGKTADKALERLDKVKGKVKEASALHGAAMESCKVYTWL
ncbi:hypothetical protein ACY2DA_09370 [Staphylococcus simulans]